MKIIICSCSVALLIVCVIANSQLQNHRYQAARKKCQQNPATKLDEETLKNAFKGEVDKAVFGAHAVCIYKDLGILDRNDEINKPQLKSNLAYVITDARKLDEVVEVCSVKRRDLEETAVEIFKCSKSAMAPYLGL